MWKKTSVTVWVTEILNRDLRDCQSAMVLLSAGDVWFVDIWKWNC